VFERRHTRRGGKPDKVERLMIIVEADGLTRIYKNHAVVSMKAHRRARLHALACQVAAYYELTGDVEGFPDQEWW
jgi:hypothetical protein